MKKVSSYRKGRFLSLLTTVAVVFMLFALPTTAAYENTHKNTGNMAQDLIAVARTQIGYCEGNTSSQIDGTVAGSQNYTKYGKWYGIPDGAWCAMFISWCADQAGIPSSILPKHASCDIGMNWFKDRGQWGWGKYWGNYQGKTVYIPVPGDIVYYGNGNLNDSTHVGIVYAVDSNNIYTIEGNTSDKCAYKQWSLNDDYIYGYGHPNYTGGGTDNPSGPSNLSVTGANYPESLATGKSFSIYGTVSSNYKITWVRVGVYRPDGSLAISETVKPGTNTFSISSVDDNIKFGSLAAGKYTYCIEAADTSGIYRQLLLQPFTVGSGSGSSVSFDYKVTTSSTNLNMRSGPSTSYSVVGSLPKGTVISITKVSGNWAYTTYNGVSGWASMDYLTVQKIPDDVTYTVGSATPVPTPTMTPTPSPTQKPAPSSTPAPTEAPDVGDQLTLLPQTEGLTIADGYLFGLNFEVSVADLILNFEDSAAISIVNTDGTVMTSDAYAGTGSRIQLKDGATVKDELVVLIIGDTDGDGSLRSSDYLRVKHSFEGKLTLEGIYLTAADINNSGEIDTSDYMRIKLYFEGNRTF